MITIPVLPEMLESVEDDAELCQKYDMEQVANYVSGMFVTWQSMGEAIGPMISSSIAEWYSFTVSQEFFAIVLLVFSFSYFSFCGNFSMFGRDNRQYGSKMQDGEEMSLIDNEINQTPERAAGGSLVNNNRSNDNRKATSYAEERASLVKNDQLGAIQSSVDKSKVGSTQKQAPASQIKNPDNKEYLKELNERGKQLKAKKNEILRK